MKLVKAEEDASKDRGQLVSRADMVGEVRKLLLAARLQESVVIS